MALPSDSVALSGSFVPPAKSKVEKLDVMVGLVPVVDEVVEDVVNAGAPPSRVVVDPVDDVGDDPPDMIVAAPAAMTHKSDNPAPTMEPVSLIFMFATPAY